MNIKTICTFLFLVLIPFILVGQKKSKSSYSSKGPSAQELIDRAEIIKGKDPIKAISIIDNIITSERKKKVRSTVLNQAFYLLGNIYEEIDQDKLAEERYMSAIKASSKRDKEIIAKTYYRLGVIALQRRNEKRAFDSFTYCIDYSEDKAMSLKCEEGIADIKIMINDNQAAIEDLELLKSKYDLDSISLARIESRKSQAYVNLKDFENASNSLQISNEQIPKNKKIAEEDVAQLERANDNFYTNAEISNFEKIEVQDAIVNLDGNDDNLVQKNFRKALLYEEDNLSSEALKSLEESIKNITPKTSAALASDVYKKSYESNLERGRISLAIEDHQKYIASKEAELEEQKNKLQKEIEVVKSQKKIDLSLKDFDLLEKDEILMQNQIFTQRIIIGLLSFLILASILFLYFLFRSIKSKRRANQMLYLKSLRTQMNPHFIFNALNSVNSFISQNDEKSANKFLSEFSHLMRRVLDYSQKDFISIQDEIELNELYLKLEHFRFRDKFNYEFQNTISDAQNIQVPPMLIQPFIENAVWHGLRYKDEPGTLKVSFEEMGNHVLVSIKDDGIGRAKSSELKTKNQKRYNSTGINNVSKRMQLINEIYSKKYEISVEDLSPEKEDKGTIVKVKIPIS